MRSISHELLAVAAVAGPQLTRAELETKAFLADMDIISAHIEAMPREQRMERSAAVLAQIVRPADAEAVRAAYWMRAPLPARMVAVMAARLKKERANDALATFNALERGMVWMELEKLLANLATIQKCMQGGKVPANKGAVH